LASTVQLGYRIALVDSAGEADAVAARLSGGAAATSLARLINEELVRRGSRHAVAHVALAVSPALRPTSTSRQTVVLPGQRSDSTDEAGVEMLILPLLGAAACAASTVVCLAWGCRASRPGRRSAICPKPLEGGSTTAAAPARKADLAAAGTADALDGRCFQAEDFAIGPLPPLSAEDVAATFLCPAPPLGPSAEPPLAGTALAGGRHWEQRFRVPDEASSCMDGGSPSWSTKMGSAPQRGPKSPGTVMPTDLLDNSAGSRGKTSSTPSLSGSTSRRSAGSDRGGEEVPPQFFGYWLQRSRPRFSAAIEGNRVRYGDGDEQDVFVADDGTLELRSRGGGVRRGWLVGEELLWDNGEVWNRARSATFGWKMADREAAKSCGGPGEAAPEAPVWTVAAVQNPLVADDVSVSVAGIPILQLGCRARPRPADNCYTC